MPSLKTIPGPKAKPDMGTEALPGMDRAQQGLTQVWFNARPSLKQDVFRALYIRPLLNRESSEEAWGSCRLGKYH